MIDLAAEHERQYLSGSWDRSDAMEQGRMPNGFQK
jgi:hypothetical protein